MATTANLFLLLNFWIDTMVCTTFLHSGELNQKLPNAEAQLLLETARKETGKDWQVVAFPSTKKKWFSSKVTTYYGVYVHVGGVGPWQQINFYVEGNKSSFGCYVSLETVCAYFQGILSGTQAKETPSLPD